MKLELNIDTFKGKIFDEINVSRDENEIIFKEKSGKIYKMFHEQDCCESVIIEDICGDLKSLLNTPILYAEESSKRGDDEDSDSSTWTFYKLATVNGWVDIRWFGSSNGYYSESVSIYEYEPEELEEEEDDTPLNIAEETMEKVKFLLNYLDYDGLCSLSKYIEEVKEEEYPLKKWMGLTKP